MSELPKLKVTWLNGYPDEEVTCTFEEARQVVFSYVPGVLALVEGHTVNSYEELVQLAARDEYKDKEALGIVLVEDLVCGG